MTRVSAVILAAGAGTRLGGIAKALLSTRDQRTFLGAIIATAREAGLHEAIVVVGPPFGTAVAAHAQELGARAVWNRAPERGEASSIALGFGALDEAAGAAWLWPVDHPDVSAATLRAMIGDLGDHAAARPVVGWHGGFPLLLTRALWPALAACVDGEQGLRGVLATANVIDVSIGDDGCIRDVDTANDLEPV